MGYEYCKGAVSCERCSTITTVDIDMAEAGEIVDLIDAAVIVEGGIVESSGVHLCPPCSRLYDKTGWGLDEFILTTSDEEVRRAIEDEARFVKEMDQDQKRIRRERAELEGGGAQSPGA